MMTAEENESLVSETSTSTQSHAKTVHEPNVDSNRRNAQSERQAFLLEKPGKYSMNTSSSRKSERSWTRASLNRELSCSLFAMISAVLLFWLVFIHSKSSLPDPLTYEPSAQLPFNLTNALRLVDLLGKKKRWVTTAALDDAMQRVFNEVKGLVPVASENNLRLDVQIFRSGPSSFEIPLTKFVVRHTYSNLTSVVARLRPARLPEDTDVKALLINAHVDSAVSSPGVSDVVGGVAIIIELIRTLASLRPDVNELRRPVIFLLNGGEEVIVQAAHSFITQHPWGRSAAAHINFESIGSGNAYHLFRLGPTSPWLARAYAKAVSVPLTSVTHTDAFETKLIPGETDFVIFNEYGNIPGFDFALLDNGYIYHTNYDDLQNFDPQGLLHGGILGFELALQLAGKTDAIGAHLSGWDRDDTLLRRSARSLAKRLNMAKGPKDTKVVFFDVLRLFTVVYEEEAALLINVAILTATILIWGFKLAFCNAYDLLFCLRMVFVILGCSLAAFLSSSFSSLVYAQLFKAKLVWYGSTLKALVVFCPPMMYGVFSAMLVLLPRRLPFNRFDHMLFAVSMILWIILACMTWATLMSSYIPAIALIVMDFCALQGAHVSPILKHLQLFTVYSIFTSQCLVVSLSALLPLLGRFGSEKIPHDTIGSVIVTFICFIYVVMPCFPILCQYAPALRRLRILALLMSTMVAVWFLTVGPTLNESRIYTPYTRKAPKRLSIFHFHSPQMNPPSVLQIMSQDGIDPDLERIAARLSSSDEDIGSLESMPRFGSLNATPFESFYPFRSILGAASIKVLRSGRIPNLPMPVLNVVNEKRIEDGWNITLVFSAQDAHQATIRFGCGQSRLLKGWSLNAFLECEDESVWIKHHGSNKLSLWLLVGSNNKELAPRPKVTALISSTRFGYSRSPNDLAVLNFELWESPASVASVATEVLV